MGSVAEVSYAEIAPPRRGEVIALAVDSTARAYDLKAVALGGTTPDGDLTGQHHVVLWMQAETNDVFFYFAGGSPDTVATTDVDDVDDTAKIAAGGAIAFANTYSAVLKAGNAPIRVRIDRRIDRFVVVKAASSAGILRFWAGSVST